MIISVGQRLAVQVKGNVLASGDDDILGGVSQQRDGALGVLFNRSDCICEGVIVCTSVCNSTVFTADNGVSIGGFVLDGGIAFSAEVSASTFGFAVGRIEAHKATAGNSDSGGAFAARRIIAVQYKFISQVGVRVFLLNTIRTTVDNQFTTFNINCVHVTDKSAVLDGALTGFILKVDSVAIIFLSIQSAVANDSQIAVFTNGN